MTRPLSEFKERKPTLRDEAYPSHCRLLEFQLQVQHTGNTKPRQCVVRRTPPHTSRLGHSSGILNQAERHIYVYSCGQAATVPADILRNHCSYRRIGQFLELERTVASA